MGTRAEQLGSVCSSAWGPVCQGKRSQAFVLGAGGGGDITSTEAEKSGVYSVSSWGHFWHLEWGRTVPFTAGQLASWP